MHTQRLATLLALGAIAAGCATSTDPGSRESTGSSDERLSGPGAWLADPDRAALRPGTGLLLAPARTYSQCMIAAAQSPSAEIREDVVDVTQEYLTPGGAAHPFNPAIGDFERRFFERTVAFDDPAAWRLSTTHDYVMYRLALRTHGESVAHADASATSTTAALTPAMQAKLQADDLVGFFESCGQYFVEEIARRATFLVLVAWTRPADAAAAASLHDEIVTRIDEPIDTAAAAGFAARAQSAGVTLHVALEGFRAERAAAIGEIADVDALRGARSRILEASEGGAAGVVDTFYALPWWGNFVFAPEGASTAMNAYRVGTNAHLVAWAKDAAERGAAELAMATRCRDRVAALRASDPTSSLPSAAGPAEAPYPVGAFADYVAARLDPSRDGSLPKALAQFEALRSACAKVLAGRAFVTTFAGDTDECATLKSALLSRTPDPLLSDYCPRDEGDAPNDPR